VNPDANWLTVDAGDYVDRAANGAGCSSKCKFMVTSYAGLKYDVLNIGKQEAWMGYATLKSLIDTSKTTRIISANLLDKKTNKPLAKPFAIKKYRNMRIGILGLLSEADFPRGSALLDSTSLAIMPYMDAAKKYLPDIERKVDAVVVLAELSSGQIDTLIRAYPAIDLVISTGALRTGETISTIGRTRILGTGSSGYNGHYVMMDFNPAWGDSIAYVPFQDQLTESYEEKSVWSDKLTAFNADPTNAVQPSQSPSITPVNPSGATQTQPAPSTGTTQPGHQLNAQPGSPSGSPQPGHEGHTHG
jgi:2',3'-cyclic-nucleotide 2'-phosphodiesterase (5'-nucleotidase family)